MLELLDLGYALRPLLRGFRSGVDTQASISIVLVELLVEKYLKQALYSYIDSVYLPEATSRKYHQRYNWSKLYAVGRKPFI